MTDRDEQLEALLRAQPLLGLSDDARQRLSMDLGAVTTDNADLPAALSGAVVDQNLRGKTQSKRHTIWRRIVTHRYAAASVAAVVCLAAITGSVIVALQMSRDTGINLASNRPNPFVDAAIPSGKGKRVALNSKLSEVYSPRRLVERSLKQRVLEAEAIVVATFVDFGWAKPGRPGAAAEMLMRFRVARNLKGKIDKKIITIRKPGPPVGAAVKEIAGKEWILLLTPEYMAGKHSYADLNTIKLEPEVRAILAGKRPKAARPVLAFSRIHNVNGWSREKLKKFGISVKLWKHPRYSRRPPNKWVQITFDGSLIPKTRDILMTARFISERGVTESAARVERGLSEKGALTLLFMADDRYRAKAYVDIILWKDQAGGGSSSYGYQLSMKRIFELAK